MSDAQSKRTYGSGSVIVHRGAWYGRWWIGGRYVKRKLGAIREPGTREGLTRKQAEAALRRQMTEVRVVVPEERMTFREAGDRYLHHLEHVKRRKPSTVQDYRIIHNKHLSCLISAPSPSIASALGTSPPTYRRRAGARTRTRVAAKVD